MGSMDRALSRQSRNSGTDALRIARWPSCRWYPFTNTRRSCSGKGQRTQHSGVQHGEDGCVAAQGHAKRHDRHHGEAGIPEEPPDRIGHVLHRPPHHPPPVTVSAPDAPPCAAGARFPFDPRKAARLRASRLRVSSPPPSTPGCEAPGTARSPRGSRRPGRYPAQGPANAGTAIAPPHPSPAPSRIVWTAPEYSRQRAASSSR